MIEQERPKTYELLAFILIYWDRELAGTSFQSNEIPSKNSNMFLRKFHYTVLPEIRLGK